MFIYNTEDHKILIKIVEKHIKKEQKNLKEVEEKIKELEEQKKYIKKQIQIAQTWIAIQKTQHQNIPCPEQELSKPRYKFTKEIQK